MAMKCQICSFVYLNPFGSYLFAILIPSTLCAAEVGLKFLLPAFYHPRSVLIPPQVWTGLFQGYNEL